jgi:hypothetical protein
MSYYEDPDPGMMRGRKIYVSPGGTVNFLTLPSSKMDVNIDLNWRRLRNMAKPIVDEALGHLAMSGIWHNQPMAIDLGVLRIDNKRVRIDENSYFDMEKDDDNLDMERCDKKWKDGDVKRARKNKSNENTPPEPCNVPNAATAYLDDTKKEKSNEGEDDINGTELCELCLDDPCIWIKMREAMLDYDDNEHDHLAANDYPPNNVRRKKIYRQMFLYINSGPSGKGVRAELPKCVTDGCRVCFPSPTFMGFKGSYKTKKSKK